MDLSTLRLEVRARINEESEDFFDDDEVDRAINEAVQRFCSEEKWPFLLTEWESTIDGGDENLDLPSNVSLTRVFNLAVSGGSLANPHLLTRVDPQAGFRMRFLYEDHTGVPMYYYIHKSNLAEDEAPPVLYTAKLIPVPDADYDVQGQYMAVPVVLSGSSDEPMVPEEYQEAIAAWAAGKLFLHELGISQKSNEQFALYGKVLEQARSDLNSFSLDEVVAWGRNAPLRTPWHRDPYFRTPPTLG